MGTIAGTVGRDLRACLIGQPLPRDVRKSKVAHLFLSTEKRNGTGHLIKFDPIGKHLDMFVAGGHLNPVFFHADIILRNRTQLRRRG